MTTTNVSSCVGSSSHTSGVVDDPDDDEDKEDDVSELHFVWYMSCYIFLIIKIVMLYGIIFHCNFFLMIRNLSFMKVVMVPKKKKKKSQLDLYLEEPNLSKKKNFKLEVLS